MDKQKLGHIALFTVGATYAANYLLAKGLMPNLIGPSGFIVARVTGALLLFFPIWFFSGREVIKREHWPRLILCGLFGVAINQLMFFNGLNLTSPLNSALIMTATPIIVLVTSAILLGSQLTVRKVSGVLLGALGAVSLIYLGRDLSSSQSSSWVGDVFILINATSYSIYLVIVKPLMPHYKPITVISWAFLAGWIFVLPVGMHQFLEVEWMTFELAEVLKFSFVIVMVTFVAYLLNIFALKHLAPTTVSAYIYLQPLLVLVFTFLFLYLEIVKDYSADFTWQKLLCGLLIFVGVYLVSFEGRKKVNE